MALSAQISPNILTELSPIFQLILSLGSLFGVYLTINNKQIKQESKLNELEERFNRKDKYDDDLKLDVKKLINDVTVLNTNFSIFLKSNETHK